MFHFIPTNTGAKRKHYAIQQKNSNLGLFIIDIHYHIHSWLINWQAYTYCFCYRLLISNTFRAPEHIAAFFAACFST
jgi:hypothetical protein